MNKKLIFCLVLALWQMGFALNAAEPEKASIVIDAAKVEGPVNRYIFGHNIEAANGVGIFSAKVGMSNNGQGFWNPKTRAPIKEAVDLAAPINMGMLRYPGGCLAHNYNWKEFVGPLDKRPNYQFGIDEYITLSRALKTEPLFTISDYYGTAEDAAELVEYLNMPAQPKYPWAMKRKEWGHPEPYGIKWFELGNETNHGNHNVIPQKRYTPAEYSKWALNYMEKMRAVDPSIKLGLVTVPGDGLNVDVDWNRIVFREAASKADFVIVHFYTPNFSKDLQQDNWPQAFKAAMAAADQLGYRLRQYHALLREEIGKDLPIAVTEYNVGAVQEKPVPWRFSYIAGLHSADFIRVCLEPRNNIVTANYWQIINGYWGSIRTDGGKTELLAPYAFFKLWGEHVGSALVSTQVNAPVAASPGFAGLVEAKGTEVVAPKTLAEVPLPSPLLTSPIEGKGFRIEALPRGILKVALHHFNGNAYQKLFTVKPPASVGRVAVDYRISFEGKITLSGEGKAGLGMNDPRGYDKTHNGVGVDGLEKAMKDWEPFTGMLRTLPDAEGTTILFRFENGRELSGTIELRNLRLEAVTKESLPAYPLLTARATKSADGKTLYLVVFNKSLDQQIATSIDLRDFTWRQATFTQISGEPQSTGIPEENKGTVSADSATFSQIFPPASMTGFVFTR